MVANGMGFDGSKRWLLAGLACCALAAGCTHSRNQVQVADIAHSDTPRELNPATLADYRIAPPDVLTIETVRNVRRADEPIFPGDELVIRASRLAPLDPEADPVENQFKVVDGIYVVQPDGDVDLGPVYGTVDVLGRTIDEARAAITTHFREELGWQEAQVAVSLANVAGRQPVAGPHLVSSDGTISLGAYGSVYVAGMTLAEAKFAVEEHLRTHLSEPVVRVSVDGFNSKTVYVITDGGGFGEQVVRLPYTGNETVLDAIAQVQGLSDVSSKNIWVARPAPANLECAQTLPVDWRGITQDGMTATNYQLYPGDRIYIEADKLIELDNVVAKVLAPVERVFGVTLLGDAVVGRLENGGGAGAGFGAGGLFLP